MKTFRSLPTTLKQIKLIVGNRSGGYAIRKQIWLLRRWFSCSACCRNKMETPKVDLSQFPTEKIRNFSIIAHVDHGKSMLADRLLEDTGVISKTVKNEQVLDRLQVERERGITVKAQSASLIYKHKGTDYLLNLIDTPGHVDFNYEVSRSLSACEGVILLVDANQGVQAQTVANFFLAFELDLPVIPVLNKIDLKVARPDVVIEQLKNIFDIEPEDVLKVSAKLGTGISDVLQAIVERIPPPSADPQKPLRCLMYDTWFHQFRGVVASVVIKDGCIRKGDKIQTFHTKKQYEVQELGIMYPTEYPTDVLYAGQVGYIMANMRNIKEAQVGDTLHHKDSEVEPFPGFKPAKAMVFAGIFPSDQSEYLALKQAIEKLTLNDSSVDLNIDSSLIGPLTVELAALEHLKYPYRFTMSLSSALGQGWRLGFLGLLHMDVFVTRLEQEYKKSVIVTSPNVPYKVKIYGAKNIKQYRGDEVTVLNPCNLPDQAIITCYYEPMVNATIIAPDTYMSNVVELCQERRGSYPEQRYIDNSRVMFKSKLPLSEILVDFFDELKSMSSGYASFDYEDAGYEESDLVKLRYLINGKEVDELTMIAHSSRARQIAVKICSKLKANIPRQLFQISIQGAVGSKVIVGKDIKGYKKDVTARCYGGDITRKQKLLKAQAEGKKRMRLIGNVEVPKNAFVNILKKS